MFEFRLWLHVGPAKTGTTTIQRFLQKSRKPLRESGLLYPITPENSHNQSSFAHHFLARALKAGDIDFVRSFLSHIFRYKYSDIVLSSETFGEVSDNDIYIFAELLTGVSLKIIFYARSPVSGATSMAQQFIKAGKGTYDSVAAKPPVPKLRRSIERWTRPFGLENVIVRKFSPDSFYNGELIDDFFYTIGKMPLIKGIDRGKARNKSLTLEAVLEIDRYRARTGEIFPISPSDPRFDIGVTPFSLPDETILKIREKTNDDLIWLRDNFGIDLQ